MSLIEVKSEFKQDFNNIALHPLQSWEWGEFRKKTGIEVVRLGRFEKGKLTQTAQLTIHPIPFTSVNIGYLPKGGIPSEEMLKKLVEVGKQYKCIFIKLEPNVEKSNSHFSLLTSHFSLHPSPHPLFTKYTFQLDLTKTEEELINNMHPKTRYNIRVAQKHGVVAVEDNSDEAFNTYLQLLGETTIRQKFYAHSQTYHKLMWETLKPAGVAHLLTVRYKGKIIVTWILFLFNNVLYYPYGASSDQFKNVMASNLIMWEAIHFGKKHGAKLFDMWGALGPNPDPTDPWYGFHRFKEGYGGRLVELAGSFDLVINPRIYRLYNLIHRARETYLRIKSYLK